MACVDDLARVDINFEDYYKNYDKIFKVCAHLLIGTT